MGDLVAHQYEVLEYRQQMHTRPFSPQMSGFPAHLDNKWNPFAFLWVHVKRQFFDIQLSLIEDNVKAPALVSLFNYGIVPSSDPTASESVNECVELGRYYITYGKYPRESLFRDIFELSLHDERKRRVSFSENRLSLTQDRQSKERGLQRLCGSLRDIRPREHDDMHTIRLSQANQHYANITSQGLPSFIPRYSQTH